MIFNVQMAGGVNAKDCTATANDILIGKTAYVGKEKVTGSMADNGDVDTAIVNGILKDGYTSGGAIENLSAENIRKGIPIGGVVGDFEDILKFPSSVKGGGLSYDIRNTRISFGNSSTTLPYSINVPYRKWIVEYGDGGSNKTDMWIGIYCFDGISNIYNKEFHWTNSYTNSITVKSANISSGIITLPSSRLQISVDDTSITFIGNSEDDARYWTRIFILG